MSVHAWEKNLEQAQDALHQQNWASVLKILSPIDPRTILEPRVLGALWPKVYLCIGRALRRMGNYQEAERCLRTAIQHSPPLSWEYSRGLIELTHVYRARGEIETAWSVARRLQQSLASGKQDLDLEYGIAIVAGRILTRLGFFSAAEAMLERALKILENNKLTHDAPVHAQALGYLGDVYLGKGDFQTAQKLFLQSLQESRKTHAHVSFADAVRRLTLARICAGVVVRSNQALKDLAIAQQHYELTQDRGRYIYYAELGEALRANKSQDALLQAAKVFDNGIWAARSISHQLREAHCLLGYAETQRILSRPDEAKLYEALRIYQASRCEWGIIHGTIAKILIENNDLRRRKLVGWLSHQLQDKSQIKGEWPWERQLLQTVSQMTSAEIGSFLHPLNYC